MAQISHLSACFKCCTGQKGNESQPSKANSQGTWMNPWHIRAHSDEMSHQNNEELYPICIQQKQTNSVAIISQESMFWYPKKALQNPANAEKGELYAGQPPARVCPIWLTINGRTPFICRRIRSKWVRYRQGLFQ